MFLRSFKLFVATLVAALLSVACGNDAPAPPPTGLAASAAESSATVSWDMVDGVEYWLFFGPSSVAPATTASMQGWFGLPGGNVLLKVTSPYVVTGLANGTNYSFSINARTNGGPGGAGAAPVVITPRIAGAGWSAGNPISGGADLRAVTYGTTTTSTVVNSTTTTVASTTYVAAGTNGAMFSSTDAANWSTINYASSSNINGAAYFGSYKLVGDGGLVLLSSDATTWTVQTSGTTQNLYAITSNNLNLNVAVGANGTIITSTDGIAWTAAGNTGTTRDLYAVVYTTYNGGTWVAVGAGGTMVQSPDGLTWTSVNSNTQADLHGISYGVTSLSTLATAFVAVGASGTVLTSTDGANWTSQTLPSAGTLNAVTYGMQFVTVGNAGTIFYSTDGVGWTLAPAASMQNLYSVARGNLLYSAVGAAGSNLLSK